MTTSSSITIPLTDAFQSDAFQADAFQMLTAPSGAIVTASVSTGHERGSAERRKMTGSSTSSPGKGGARS